jgi:type II secretory pathway component PulF
MATASATLRRPGVRSEQGQPKVRIKSKRHAAIKADDIISFFQQLSTLLTAGTPLLRSLQIAGEQSESDKFVVVLRQLASHVASGTTLYDAMVKHPKIFDHQWVQMIKAGERSGQLAETVLELTAYIKTRRAMRSKVVGAMIYPCILVFVLIASLAVMLGKVVPTFAEFLHDFGQELPAITQAVIGASNFFQAHLIGFIGGPIVGGVALRYYVRTASGRRQKDVFVIKMPLFGQLTVDSMMERFAHNLALLLKSGTPLLEALGILQDIFSRQGVYGPALASVFQAVGKGRGLGTALEQTGLFTPLVVNMIRVGEETGRLNEVLGEVAEYYRARVEVIVGRITGMMEPLIVIFMGASVGVILLSVYLPMFQMAGGAPAG